LTALYLQLQLIPTLQILSLTALTAKCACVSPFPRRSYMRNVFFQLFDPLQGRILGLSIFQQSSHIEHVVQVSLNLHLELVALRVLQFLRTKTQEKAALAQLWRENIMVRQPTCFRCFQILQSFPREGLMPQPP